MQSLSLQPESSSAADCPSHSGPQVLYGATDLLTPTEFLAQLEELGRKSGITGGLGAAAAAGAKPPGS